MTSRTLALSFGALTFAVTGSLAAAPGVYPVELAPDPIPTASLVSPQAEESAYRLDDAISVVQALGGNGASVAVPVCVTASNKIGHAYAKKNGATYQSVCRVDGAAAGLGRIVRPTRVQLSTVYWVPHQKGAALPRSLAALSFDSNGVALYACKVRNGPNEQVGELLPTGECQLAPMIRGLGAGRVEPSSLVLVRGGSQGASAAPAYGWIYPKSRQHHPGGTLLKWPNGAVYCQGRVQGAMVPGSLETAADGSVAHCLTWQPGASIATTEDIAVFRNDAQSQVEFVDGAGALPRVTAGGKIPCAILRDNTAHIGFMEGTRCRSRTSLDTGYRVQQLVRRGPWPDQG